MSSNILDTVNTRHTKQGWQGFVEWPGSTLIVPNVQLVWKECYGPLLPSSPQRTQSLHKVRLTVDATWEDITKKGMTCSSCLLGQTSPYLLWVPSVDRGERCPGPAAKTHTTMLGRLSTPNSEKHPFFHPFFVLSPWGEPGIEGGSCGCMFSKCQASTVGYGYYTLNSAKPSRHPC